MKQAIILFGKYPREGFVKTRLAATIGDTKATAFYKVCLQHMFDEALTLTKECDIFFYFAEASDSDEVNLMVPKNIKVVAQPEIDLPNRIKHAFSNVFNKGYDRVAIFSTDTPELKSIHMKMAFDALTTHDIAVGPDSDGGYYCLSLSSYNEAIFDVKYGNGIGMFEQTVSKANELTLKFKKLEVVSDVDTVDDLRNFSLQSSDIWNQYYAQLNLL